MFVRNFAFYSMINTTTTTTTAFGIGDVRTLCCVCVYGYRYAVFLMLKSNVNILRNCGENIFVEVKCEK